MEQPKKLQAILGLHPPIDMSSTIDYHILIDKVNLPILPLLPDCLIGIEVEVERVHQRNNIMELGRNGYGDDTYLWKNTEDGSLRNDGREFVSTPLKGKGIPYALNVLSKHLHTNQNCIGHEFTDRTSVHIHINVQDMTPKELMSFIYTYIMVEPLMYHYAGRERGEGIFCVPITQSSLGRLLKKYIEYINTGDDKRASLVSDEWMKYTGFNLAPVMRYGTVEFRHMAGTIDETRLMNWINLIMSIKQFAMCNNHKELKSRIFEMNTNSEYRYFIQDVFGSLSKLVEQEDFQTDLEKCVVFLKDLHHSQKLTDVIDTKNYLEAPTKNNLMQSLIKLGWIKVVDVEVEVRQHQSSINELKKSNVDITVNINRLKQSLESNVILPASKKELTKQYKYWNEILTYNERQIKDLAKLIENLRNPKEEEYKIYFDGVDTSRTTTRARITRPSPIAWTEDLLPNEIEEARNRIEERSRIIIEAEQELNDLNGDGVDF